MAYMREPGEIVMRPRRDAPLVADVSSEPLHIDPKALAWGIGVFAGLLVIGISLARARTRTPKWSRFARRRQESGTRVLLASLGRFALQKGLDHLLSGRAGRDSMSGESRAHA